jgi:ferric-dicitrate binding protein FerR (iron transport regulator)
LLQRYLDDQLTETEHAELASWLQQYPTDEPWSEWLQSLGMQQPVASGYDRSRWQPVVEAILQQQGGSEKGWQDGREQERRIPSVRQMTREKWRWVAAAAIVTGIITGGYLLFFDRPGKEVANTEKALPIDIPAPTGTRTTLTLAGGKTILLDSVQNGALAEQGNARVSKLANNQLAYNTSTEAGAGAAAKPIETVYNTLSTAKGGQTMVVLADGTKVWLDATSSLTYPTAFAGGTRTVVLTGQAYFEVAHRPNQPFTVKVSGTEVKDIGTAFNINAYGDEPVERITLVEGVVAVRRQGAQIVLKPGQQARFDGEQLSVAAGVDVDEVLAWKNGQFQFDNAGTAEIMRQVARWYDVDVRYEGDVLQRHFSGGVSRTANASALLDVLELTKSVRFRVEGKQIIVQPYQ